MDLPFYEEIQILLTVAGVISGTAELIKEGIKPDIQHLVLPSLATTYGAAIFANSVYARFSFDAKGFIIYLIGFLLSLRLHSNSAFMFLIKETPTISKAMSFISTVKSKEEDHEMFSWMLVNTFAGMFIKDLIFKRRFKVKNMDLFSIVAKNGGLYLIRRYELHPLTSILLMFALSGAEHLAGMLKRVSKVSKEETSSSTAPSSLKVSIDSPSQSGTSLIMKRPPRRKASVVNSLETKSTKGL